MRIRCFISFVDFGGGVKLFEAEQDLARKGLSHV